MWNRFFCAGAFSAVDIHNRRLPGRCKMRFQAEERCRAEGTALFPRDGRLSPQRSYNYLKYPRIPRVIRTKTPTDSFFSAGPLPGSVETEPGSVA